MSKDITKTLHTLDKIVAKIVEDRDAEIARLTAELAAARAVPGDVEAALLSLDGRSFETGRKIGAGKFAESGPAADLRVAARDALRTAIARAISDATAARGTVGGLLATANPHPDGCHSADVMAERDCETDGHMSCPTCTRNSRGPLPKGG